MRFQRYGKAAAVIGLLAAASPANAGLQLLSSASLSPVVTRSWSGPPFQPYPMPGQVATYNSFWGLSAYSWAQCTGSVTAVRLRRASDNAVLGIVLTTSCDLDVATASTHCNATTCTVAEVCDQPASNNCTGTYDLIQNTAGNQPAFIFNCIGLHPCIRSTTSTMQLTSANSVTPATGVVSLYAVAGNTVGTATCTFLYQNGTAGNRLGNSSTAIRVIGGTSGTLGVSATIAMHAIVGIANGSSSIINVDGNEAVGTVSSSTTAFPPGGFRGNVTAVTCDGTAAGFSDNVVWTQTQRQTLVDAARNYWGL